MKANWNPTRPYSSRQLTSQEKPLINSRPGMPTTSSPANQHSRCSTSTGSASPCPISLDTAAGIDPTGSETITSMGCPSKKRTLTISTGGEIPYPSVELHAGLWVQPAKWPGQHGVCYHGLGGRSCWIDGGSSQWQCNRAPPLSWLPWRTDLRTLSLIERPGPRSRTSSRWSILLLPTSKTNEVIHAE